MPRKKADNQEEPKIIRRRGSAAQEEPKEAEAVSAENAAAEEAPKAAVKRKRGPRKKSDPNQEVLTFDAGDSKEESVQPIPSEEQKAQEPTAAEGAEETVHPRKRRIMTRKRQPKEEPISETLAAESQAAETEQSVQEEPPAIAQEEVIAEEMGEADSDEKLAADAAIDETPDIDADAEEESVSEEKAVELAELEDEAAEEPKETPREYKNGRGQIRGDRAQIRHQHPKLGFNQLAGQTLAELRKIAKETGVTSITTRRKDDLINDILKTQAEALGYRFNGGTLECMPEGYGFLRPSGLLPSSSDIYVSASQIRRFGLRNGDVVWGIIRPPKDQEHYEALLRVENVNFTDPEEARHRPHFEQLTPIFPDEKLQLETDRRQIATRIVDIFAPIGKGQRALIVSPPKAGKTTLLKNLAHSITTNHPEVILMVLLIDERPEEVTDMARSVDGEIIASTFDRPAEEHLRVAGLALEKAKRLVEVNKDVVLLLDSITRLARASNLIVPPSGRTLSGGMDPAALYFPKKFFGAARNIENGGSLTIIGTSLVETGSRMDDVIYEEFKGTGNMEVHLSRKISEQRIFPALDITKSGTRKEELMVPEADLQRIWGLRRKIANMDEAEVLNLILDKLRNTPTNRDFLATIKAG